MAVFESALWDGSDPLYAPCTNKVPKRERFFYWTCPAKYVELGYAVKSVRLPGEAGDGKDLERAQKARDLTREMLRWHGGDDARLTVGTWKWLIARYMSDRASPFQQIKANSKEDYRFSLRRWEETIGSDYLHNARYEELMRWHDAMAKAGRSTSYISRMFRMLRIVVNYGVLIEVKEAERVSVILSKMRIKTAPQRNSAPTRSQIESIIAAADGAGEGGFALGLSIMWWFALRAVDVRGHWLKTGDNEESGGIIRSGKRWQDGLTWDMFDRDLRAFRKVPSKTRASLTEELEFDLSSVPEVQRRLMEVPASKRVGPVILSRLGVPFTNRGWAEAFQRHREAAGVPSTVWMMDTRAAAITDAKEHGATLAQRRDAAGHLEEKTTDRYSRSRSQSIAEVVKLRRSER